MASRRKEDRATGIRTKTESYFGSAVSLFSVKIGNFLNSSRNYHSTQSPACQQENEKILNL